MKKLILILICSLFCLTICCQEVVMYSIPKQKIDVFKLLGDTTKIFYGNGFSKNRKQIPYLLMDIDSFQISEQIKYRDYKKYLKSIKKDSSEIFYKSQLPDSTIFPGSIYRKYINDKYFDDFPVIGISWENALNYCKWITVKSNHNDTLEFIYRLPYLSEWLSAQKYFESELDQNFNINYSDWLLNSKDETTLSTDSIDFNYFYIDFSQKDSVLLRKWICGKSWKYNFKYPIDYYKRHNYYSYKGYNHISFRYVKYIVREKTFIKDNIRHKYPIEYWLIKDWGGLYKL